MTGDVVSVDPINLGKVVINLPNANKLIYLHLSQIDVHEGRRVKTGDKLGLSGSKRVGSPHLHIEVRTNYSGKFALGGVAVGNVLPLRSPKRPLTQRQLSIIVHNKASEEAAKVALSLASLTTSVSWCLAAVATFHYRKHHPQIKPASIENEEKWFRCFTTGKFLAALCPLGMPPGPEWHSGAKTELNKTALY